jgi:hypothetical protein
MQLSSIKKFLDVYRKNIDTEDAKRSAILRILKEEIGVDISEKSLTITKGVLKIKTNAVIRNEIFLRKEKLLGRFKKNNELGVYDIAL